MYIQRGEDTPLSDPLALLQVRRNLSPPSWSGLGLMQSFRNSTLRRCSPASGYLSTTRRLEGIETLQHSHSRPSVTRILRNASPSVWCSAQLLAEADLEAIPREVLASASARTPDTTESMRRRGLCAMLVYGTSQSPYTTLHSAHGGGDRAWVPPPGPSSAAPD